MTCNLVDLDFYKGIEKLLDLNDSEWGMYLLSKGTLYKRMGDTQKEQLICDSLHCAEGQYFQWQQRGLADVDTLLKAESVRIEEDNHPLNPLYLYFAEYEAKSLSIRVSNEAIQQTEKAIRASRLHLLLGEVKLRHLIIAHELFHHLESRQPDLFTQKPNAEFKRLGRFRYRTRVAAASEIAAVHFSKLMLGLTYSPAVMEILLTYSVNRQRAQSVIRQLIGEKWG